MAYRYGNRYEKILLPPSIEEYIDIKDPVRVYDVFVNSLDLRSLGIEIDTQKVGNSEYDPRAMIKLILYGASYGIFPSRKLERAAYHNMSFIWLMGGLKPDHKTISEFRRNYKKALQVIFKKCVQLCIKLELVEGNVLFVDGSKIRANASINKTWTKERCEKYLEKADEYIEQLLNKGEALDKAEEESDSLVKLNEELADREKLKIKVESILKDIKGKEVTSINSTDSECVRVKGRQGTHAGYNGQIVVDDKNGLIVQNDVVNENNDLKQFANQIEQANENLGEKCKVACADAGYADPAELKKMDEQEIEVVVPNRKQACNKAIEPFDKDNFKYNCEQNKYICPEGHELTYRFFKHSRRCFVYKIASPQTCVSCKHFGTCTKDKNGRQISRSENEEIIIKMAQQYKKSPLIYKRRKAKVEHPFGHIKRNLGVQGFLLRGLEGVKSEMALYSTCFNIARLITILGVTVLVEKLTS